MRRRVNNLTDDGDHVSVTRRAGFRQLIEAVKIEPRMFFILENGEQLAEFVRVARGEAKSPCTGRDGVEALRVALAATRSRKEHRPVRVEEIG